MLGRGTLACVLIVFALVCLLASEPVRPKVADWSSAALQAIRDTHAPAPMAARDLAILHTCMYDAWAAYDDRAVGTQLSGALRRPAAERTEANKEKAISYAAYRALSDLLPANGDHTMVTLWNPADEPQDYIFRLEFSGGHYSLPIHLEARATRMFNISDIIMTQVPDADGNIVPAAIQSGSAHIVGSQADNQSILLAIDSGVYNVRRATCYQQCTTCSGATDFWVANSPFDVFVGGQQQEHFMDQWNTGAQYDLTSQAGWSSSNTSMATVQTGMVTGVSAGTFTLTAGDGNVPLYANSCRPYNPCPINGGGGASAPGSVPAPYQVEPVANGPEGTFPAGECPTGGQYPGYLRSVNNQVQYSTGAGYPRSVTVADTITVGAKHDLGTGTVTGSDQTDSNGVFYDEYSVCSSACPGSSGESDALQSWTVNGYPLPHSNSVIYKCTSITIDGR